MAVRTAFGRDVLQAPEPFADGGWRLFARYAGGLMITLTEYTDPAGLRRTLATISRDDNRPDRADIDLLRRTVFGGDEVIECDTAPAAINGTRANAVYLIGPSRHSPAPAGPTPVSWA